MAKNSTSYRTLLDALRRREFAPIYYLMGEESYYIDKISDFIEDHILNEDEKAFNQTIFYGKDSSIGAIINAAKQFPMGAPLQVIIVKEAQQLKNIDELQFYLKQPLPTTLLVFCHKNGKLDRRIKIAGEIEKKGVLFTSDKIYDDQVPKWITDYLAEKKIAITAKAAEMLSEFLGNDLSRIANELEKLIITKPATLPSITPEMVEKNIGISKDFNNFELVKALTNNDILKSNRIIRYFSTNERANPISVTLVVLFNFFSNLLVYHTLPDKSNEIVAKALGINAYFVKDYAMSARRFSIAKTEQIISLLRNYDAQSKGVNNVSAESGELLKELIYKILH
jgi:DNA polymerase-3 subunit delta